MAADQRPIVHFDHNSAEWARDPVGNYRDIRERCPVAYSPEIGAWVVTRYEDVARVARDDFTFSSRQVNGQSALALPPRETPEMIPIDLDPPEFFQYRRILNPILAPKAVEAMEPMIEHHASFFLDQVIERGACEVVTEFTNPLSAAVTVDWLGLPVEDWHEYAEPMHKLVSVFPDSAEFASDVVPSILASRDRIHEAVTEHRAHPRDDVISYLISAEIEGEPLPDPVIVSMINLLIGGGVNSTSGLTAHALLYLHQHPEHRVPLVADPKVLRLATEEFLRVFCPFQALGRRVTADVEVGAQQLKADEYVLIAWAAANRDPDAFPDPDQVILDRWPNRHTTFGLGIHRCVGSHLARAVIRAMLTELLTRVPDYRVLEDQVVPYPTLGVDYGWATMPIEFTPGTRVRTDTVLRSASERLAYHPAPED